MKILNIKGNILTPVHIGNDLMTYPLEYVIKSERCHFIDIDRMFHANQTVAEDFASAINDLDIGEVQKILFNELDSSFVKYSTQVDPAFVEEYDKRATDIDYPPRIHLMARSPYPFYQPIIRGSALKGAIRTAYLSCLFDKCDNDKKNFIFEQQNGPRAHDLKMLWREGILINSLSTILGEDLYNPDKDNFSSLHVEDVYLKSEDSEITRVSKASMDRNGDVRFSFPEFLETIPGVLSKKSQITEFDLRLILTNDSLFSNWQDIKKYLDEYFVSEIRREVNKKGRISQFFWEDVALSIEDQISYLDDNSTIIRMGGHIGLNYTAIRGIMPQPPKTRNLYDEGAPMGLVRLELKEEINI